MRIRTFLSSVGVSALIAVGAAGTAVAETKVIRVAQQFGLLYMPLIALLDQRLIEKHTKAAGLDTPKVELYKISGGANINKALLAKTIDFGSHGIGPLLKLWGKTNGRFKIALSMADMPLKLLTNDLKINKLEDYLNVKDHKISVPAVNVSIQAVTLQIASKNLFNDAKKLDHLTVTMKHPIAVAAMLTGGQAVKSHFATLPYSYQELQTGKVKLVTSSYDILGGQHSVMVMSTSRDFKEANPKTYLAVIAAFKEAVQWVNANPGKAAETYIRYTKSKLAPEMLKALLKDKAELDFNNMPKHTMKYANFLHSIGDIPKANDWKDYYWENNHDLPGS